MTTPEDRANLRDRLVEELTGAYLTAPDDSAIMDVLADTALALLSPPAALARIRQMVDYWEQHLPDVIRTPAVVSAIRAALEPAAVPPPTDRANLRDRITAAIDEVTGGICPADIIDAVLSVLPEPDGRAAVLSTTERDMLRYALDLAQEQMFSRGDEFTEDDQAAVDRLRRMADETPATTEVCTEHPHAPVIGGMCGGCTQYPSDMVKPQRAERLDAEAHVVGDDSDDPEHVDDCPGCEAFTLTGHRAAVARQPEHVGGNAEDCPGCEGTNPPYPFICPGPAVLDEEQVPCTCFVINDGGVHAESCAKRAAAGARQDGSQP